MDSLRDEIYQSLINGCQEEIVALVSNALSDDITAQEILDDCLIPGMQEVGKNYSEGIIFIPEMLIAARAMQQGIDVLEPQLPVRSSKKTNGLVLIGTVQGDLHDIGKNLVCMMLKSTGLEIIDLGTDVSPAAFAEATKKFQPQIVAMSALLTTTMCNMKDAIEHFQEVGLRDKVKIMVGGAPVTQAFADDIGADGFAEDAGFAAQVALTLIDDLQQKEPNLTQKIEVHFSEDKERPREEAPLLQEELPPDGTLSPKERILKALQHVEAQIPWIEIVVAEGVMAKVLGKVSLDWTPKNNEETQLGLSWDDKIEFARRTGLSALGIHHWKTLGSYQTKDTQVIGRESLIKSRADLGKLRSTKVTPSDIYPEVEKAKEAIGDSGIALYVNFPFCFDPAISDISFENFIYQLIDDPGFVAEVFKRYEEYIGNLIDIYSAIPEIDFIWIGDDIAFRSGPFLAPEMFREHVFPVFQRLAARIEKPWFFHSDGDLSLLMEDVLALGPDAIHPFEPICNDIYQIKKKYGDRVCLIGNIDIDLIARGTTKEVVDTTGQLLSSLSKGGGYMFSSGNSIPYYADIDNLLAMLLTLHKFNDEI